MASLFFNIVDQASSAFGKISEITDKITDPRTGAITSIVINVLQLMKSLKEGEAQNVLLHASSITFQWKYLQSTWDHPETARTKELFRASLDEKKTAMEAMERAHGKKVEELNEEIERLRKEIELKWTAIAEKLDSKTIEILQAYGDQAVTIHDQKEILATMKQQLESNFSSLHDSDSRIEARLQNSHQLLDLMHTQLTDLLDHLTESASPAASAASS